MKHNFSLEGYGYRLRPIKLSDAQLIIDIRLEDAERNKYIHTITRDVSLQEEWLRRYFEREGDYYFVIENRITKETEGLIAFYNEDDGKAEWGRWVIRKGSLAAIESVYLMYKIAFEKVGLKELYCRTITNNEEVVSFHTSIGEKFRTIHTNLFEVNGTYYDAVEQYSDREHFEELIAPKLEKKSAMIYNRNLKRAIGSFEFHHLGIATKGIEKELPIYTMLGYEKIGRTFEDIEQGIRGIFLEAKGQPLIELLENLEGSTTLDQHLEKNNKIYHTAYYVKDIERAVEIFKDNRAKIIFPYKESVYFKKRICFMMLSNMAMIELLEE